MNFIESAFQSAFLILCSIILLFSGGYLLSFAIIKNSKKVENPTKKSLNKNLIYHSAEDWAKQNIRLLFEDVYDWAVKSIEAINFENTHESIKKATMWFGGDWKNKNISLLFFHDFQNFRIHLFDPEASLFLSSISTRHPTASPIITDFVLTDAEFMEVLIEDINLIAHRINSSGGDADPEQIINRVKSLFWSL